MKTSNKLLLGFLIVILIGISAFIAIARLHIDKNTIAGDGSKKTKTLIVKGFDKVNIQGKFNVHLIQGPNTQLEIRAAENLIPLVEHLVENGELQIRLKKRISNNDRIELFLTAETLSSLEILNGAQLESAGTIKGESLKLKSNAGADVNLNLDYKNIEAESHAGSKLNLAGKTSQASIVSTSGAIINAYNLVTKTCKATGSAGGVAEINVTDELDVSANSGGSVSYSGNPTIKNINSNSGGSIQKR